MRDAVPLPALIPSPWNREAFPSSVWAKSLAVRSMARAYCAITVSFSARSSWSWGSSVA